MRRPPSTGLPTVIRTTTAVIGGALFAFALAVAVLALLLLGDGLRAVPAFPPLPRELFTDLGSGPALFVFLFGSAAVAGRVNAAALEFTGGIRSFFPEAFRIVAREASYWGAALACGAVAGVLHAFIAHTAGVRDGVHPMVTQTAVSLTCLLLLYVRGEWKRHRPAESLPVRGSALESAADVQKAIEQTHAPGPKHVWGGFPIPALTLGPHYLVIGVSESGKTLVLRMLMNSALPDGNGGLRARAIIYDPKRDFYPLLIGMGIAPEHISIFQPFDARCAVWDIAADVTTRDQAEEIAAILIPINREEKQPFFSDASRALTAGVMTAFHVHAPGNWTLNDLLEAMSTPDRLKSVLSTTDDGRDLLQKYFTDARDTQSNVISTIDTKLGVYRTIARLWTRTTRRVSLGDWYSGTGVILLGTHTQNQVAFAALNRAIFKRATQLILGRVEEDPPDHTWIILDEARDAGELDGLRDLLTGSRSKGGHVVLGFQDLDGFRVVYDRAAEELVGQCDNVAVLRLNSTATQKWASDYFGEYEYYAESFGATHGPTPGTSTQRSLSRSVLVLPQEFRNFPPTKPHLGLTGVFASPVYGAWMRTIPADFIESHKGAKADVPAFVKRPASDQDRRPWTDDDLRRLHIKPQPPAPGGLRTLDD